MKNNKEFVPYQIKLIKDINLIPHASYINRNMKEFINASKTTKGSVNSIFSNDGETRWNFKSASLSYFPSEPYSLKGYHIVVCEHPSGDIYILPHKWLASIHNEHLRKPFDSYKDILIRLSKRVILRKEFLYLQLHNKLIIK